MVLQLQRVVTSAFAWSAHLYLLLSCVQEARQGGNVDHICNGVDAFRQD